MPRPKTVKSRKPRIPNKTLSKLRTENKPVAAISREDLARDLPTRLKPLRITSRNIYNLSSTNKAYKANVWSDDGGSRMFLKDLDFSKSSGETSAELLSDMERIAVRADGLDQQNPLPSEIIVQLRNPGDQEKAEALMDQMILDANREYGRNFDRLDAVKEGTDFLIFRVVENDSDTAEPVPVSRPRSNSLSALSPPKPATVNVRRTRPRRNTVGSTTEAAHSLHDAMFNNRRKVAFESGLAGALFRESAMFDGIVNNTLRELSQIMTPAIRDAVRLNGRSNTPSNRALFHALANDPNTRRAYEARIKNQNPGQYPLESVATINENNQAERNRFGAYIISLLNNSLENPSATFEEKLTIIYNFADFMTRPYKFDISSNKALKDLHAVSLPNLTPGMKTELFDKWSRFKRNSGIPGLFDSTAKNASESRYPRFNKVKGVTISTNLSEDSSGLFPVSAGRPQRPINPHAALVRDQTNEVFYNITGVGLWQPGIARTRMQPKPGEEASDQLVNRQRDFAYEAMYRYDMPLIGGASGGMGSYLLTFSVIGKLNGPDLQKAFLAAASVMIGKGYHSFHELAVVANTLGVQYTPGDYLSAIPQDVLVRNKGLSDMILRFPELIMGNEINALLEGTELIAQGKTVNWTKRQDALKRKIKRFNDILDLFDRNSLEYEEAMRSYADFLDEFGLSPDEISSLATISAETASSIKFSDPQKRIQVIMDTIENSLKETIDKLTTPPGPSGRIDLTVEHTKLNRELDEWNEAFNEIPFNNRARKKALDRINSMVTEHTGMNMREFNQFLNGQPIFFKA